MVRSDCLRRVSRSGREQHCGGEGQPDEERASRYRYRPAGGALSRRALSVIDGSSLHGTSCTGSVILTIEPIPRADTYRNCSPGNRVNPAAAYQKTLRAPTTRRLATSAGGPGYGPVAIDDQARSSARRREVGDAASPGGAALVITQHQVRVVTAGDQAVLEHALGCGRPRRIAAAATSVRSCRRFSGPVRTCEADPNPCWASYRDRPYRDRPYRGSRGRSLRRHSTPP